MRKSAFGIAVLFFCVGELPETENKSCEDIDPPDGEDALEILGRTKAGLPLGRIPSISKVGTVGFEATVAGAQSSPLSIRCQSMTNCIRIEWYGSPTFRPLLFLNDRSQRPYKLRGGSMSAINEYWS